MEVLVAIAVGGMFILGATVAIVSVIKNNFENRGNQTASSLAMDLANKVESFTNNNWHNIYDLNKGSANQYFIVSSSTAAVSVSGQESILYNDVNSGLVGHWKMDETAGSLAYDSSGNYNSGTLNGSPTRTASSSCRVGGCLSFNGSNYVGIASPPNPPLYVTVSGWFKRVGVSTSDHHIIFMQGTQIEISVPDPGGQIRTGVTTATQGRQVFNSGSGVTDGSWHFLALTYDGSNLVSYIDGNQTATNPVSGALTTGSATNIGYYPGYYVNGFIDDVRVYNRALSAQEIKQIYNSAVYSRYFYLENVQRDGNNDIVASSGTDDPSTQKVVSAVEWQDGRNLKFSNYLTRYKDDVFSQYDWSGGNVGDATTSSIINTFSSSTNITAGLSLTLASTTISGDLTSLIYDSQVVGGASLNSVLWQGTKPSGTVIKFQIATSNSSGGPWTYVGSDGTGSSYYTPTNSNISKKLSGLYNSRYFRYKIFLSPDSGNSPTVNDIHLNWSK